MPERDLRSFQYRIFALLWTSYASYYLCRLNFAVAQPEILREFPDWSAARIGWIPSVYQICYALGQLLNGWLGERLGARRMMTAAMLLSACANALFSFASSYEAMIALWALNGYAQSAGWALVVKTISNWTPLERRGTVIGLISTCYQIGNVLSWLLAGHLCATWGWRAAFLVPAAIMLPVAAIFAFAVRNDPRDAGFAPVRDGQGGDAASRAALADTRLSGAEIVRATLTNRVLWVLGLGFFCLNTVRYAFMNWTVQYMSAFHGQNIKGSAFMAVALPLIGSVGAVSSGWASDRFFGGRRAPLCTLMLLGLAGVCLAFLTVPAGQWLLATALLGAAGFLMYGPDMLMSGAATVDLSHPRAAAAATGLTMCLGGAGAIFSGAGVGALKDWMEGQWSAVFAVLAGLAVVSALLMTTLWNAKPKGAKR